MWPNYGNILSRDILSISRFIQSLRLLCFANINFSDNFDWHLHLKTNTYKSIEYLLFHILKKYQNVDKMHERSVTMIIERAITLIKVHKTIPILLNKIDSSNQVIHILTRILFIEVIICKRTGWLLQEKRICSQSLGGIWHLTMTPVHHMCLLSWELL